MKAYSIDLRERVVRSAENGRGQSWIAREFGIALGTVKRYLKRYQTSGTLQPTPQRREQPRISEADLPALQAQVDAYPDATIAQHIDYWAASHGLRVGQATMCRALQRANRPLKKNVAGLRTR
jgi:transposase